MVREMTITGSARAGFLKARKMRVRRMSRRTTKPPPSWFMNADSRAGRMAARSMRFAGATRNSRSFRAGPWRRMGWKPITRSRTFSSSKSSDRTSQTVKSRATYSRMKSTRQMVSIVSKAGAGLGSSSSDSWCWQEGSVPRMKQQEERMMVMSTSTETICARCEESGSSKVRKILSKMVGLIVMLRFLYTWKNSPQDTKPSPFSSYCLASKPSGSLRRKNRRSKARWKASIGTLSSPSPQVWGFCSRRRVKITRMRSSSTGISRGMMKPFLEGFSLEESMRKFMLSSSSRLMWTSCPEATVREATIFAEPSASLSSWSFAQCMLRPAAPRLGAPPLLNGRLLAAASRRPGGTFASKTPEARA
mmetsp:Transcript_32429/g.102963  ORF Transcript_32429/g.102963 Transcript_32429/m.102963 type:complete len:362 (+) Transcript_32429:1451-2536(+)